MPRESKVLIWCDLCHQKGLPRVPATTVSINVGEDMVGQLDLCADHQNKIRLAVRRVVPRVPRRRRTARDSAGPYVCQVAGCGGAPLKNTRTLWQHVRLLHELSMDEYRSQYGEPVALDAKALEVVEVRCDVDGCGATYSTELGNKWPRQALVSHLRGRHGLKLTPEGEKIPIG